MAVEEITIKGLKPRITSTEKMVGHTITTHRIGKCTSKVMNDRAEESIRRTKLVSTSGLPYEQRRLLIETSAIPVSWCGCQWHLPRADLQTKASNAVVKALWGHKRTQRSREIVLAILHDPTKVDPSSSFVFKRIVDARRMLRKSSEKHDLAIYVNELLNSDETEKYHISGPVHALRRAAQAPEGNLVTKNCKHTICFDDDFLDLPMTSQPCKYWKHKLKQRIQHITIASLSNRCVSPDSFREEDSRTRRDLYGIGRQVNEQATLGLIEGSTPRYPESVKEIVLPDANIDYKSDNLWRERVKALLAGSVRAYDRLTAADLCDGSHCHLCEAAKGDIDHLFWQCPFFDEQRTPFVRAMTEVTEHIKREDPWRGRELDRILDLPCIRRCGIIPDSPFLHSSANLPRQDQGCFVKHSERPSDLTDRDRNGETYRNGKLMVYVDGSAYNPTDRRSVRVGWGVFVGNNHRWNSRGHLPGLTQTSLKAELAAVAHALATLPGQLHIVSDCLSVVNLVSQFLHGRVVQTDGAEEVWQVIADATRGKMEDYHTITWIKSHVTSNAALQSEFSGSFTREECRRNDCADDLAKEGARLHDTNPQTFQAADDRAILASLVQRMQASIWKDFFALHEDHWGDDFDNPGVNHDQQCHQEIPFEPWGFIGQGFDDEHEPIQSTWKSKAISA